LKVVGDPQLRVVLLVIGHIVCVHVQGGVYVVCITEDIVFDPSFHEDIGKTIQA
jgi:hypothetical protein